LVIAVRGDDQVASFSNHYTEAAFAHEVQTTPHVAITGVTLTLLIRLTPLAHQVRFALKVPGGLAFSEFKEYDTWQSIAVRETETSVKAILGNPTMIAAYRRGVPEWQAFFRRLQDREDRVARE
jgi:hypothetical protein